MKFVVAVDCEGVACGVGSPGASLNSSRNLAFAQLQATREADAAVRGLFDAGAERVIVWDNHNGSLNLDYDLLDERCDIALGVGFEHRFPGMDESFDGVLLIGYHAMDDTVDGVMCHTFSSTTYQWIEINGRKVGEMAIDAAVAGERGVPAIFASSDDKGTAEAERFFPGVVTVTTKQGMGWNCAVSKHPRRVEREIFDAVQRAVAKRDAMKRFAFSSPLMMDVRYKRLEAAQSASRSFHGAERVDAYTVRRVMPSIQDYY